MTTINTIEDFLRIVRENEELRSAIRRELLTEDLLALPSEFAEMRKTQDSMQESLKATMETQSAMLETQNTLLKSLAAIMEEQRQMRGDITNMRGDITEMRGDITEMRGDITNIRGDVTEIRGDITETRRDIGALHGMYRRQHDDLARFRGNYAFESARRNDVAIARLFAHRHGLRQINVRVLPHNERRVMLVENQTALAGLDLWDPMGDTFLRPDLVAEVTDLAEAEQPRYYIAAEASFTADDKEIARVTDHAKIIRCATGRDAYAIVAAVRLDSRTGSDRLLEDPEEYLNANNEDTALWYPLPEDDLEPPDPC